MARVAVWALAVAAAGWVAGLVGGCQPAKEVPDMLPKGTEPSTGPTIPTASEPSAKAYIEKAAKAMTNGRPELLAKGKVSRAVFKGRQFRQNQPAPFEVTRTIAAVWPNRLADIDEVQAQGVRTTVSAHLRRPHFVMGQNGVEVPPPNLIEVERIFAADETAQYWMAFLLPVTDDKAVVFDLQARDGLTPGTGQKMPIQMVKLALGEFPVYQLTFDAKSDLLLRVDYITLQQGVHYQKRWNVTERKPGLDGLVLPTKVEFWQDERLAEQFDVEKWEFPASIPDTEFDPPKN